MTKDQKLKIKIKDNKPNLKKKIKDKGPKIYFTFFSSSAVRTFGPLSVVTTLVSLCFCSKDNISNPYKGSLLMWACTKN